MPRPGPRRVPLNVKVLPDLLPALDDLAAQVGADDRSALARRYIEEGMARDRRRLTRTSPVPV